MSAEEICKVIGSGRKSAPGAENGRPIAKTTLFRHFKDELANGRSMLKAGVAGRFYNALDNNEPSAIQMAMRNQFGWDNGRAGFHIDPAALLEDKRESSVHVHFVLPSRNGAGRALSQEALEAELPPPRYDPAPPGQKLLPPPRPMFKNAFGMWEELPDKGK
jgi:hypothetical protein